MTLDLPPLKALPAFEAAGRLLSFTKAAEQLNITQAGISFQVRSLETALDVRLFDRRHRGLSLTPEGELLLRAVQEGLRTIADAKARISPRNRSDVVKVTAPLSLTSKWLALRVASLQADNPDLRLRVEADDDIRDLDAENIDLAIRYLPVTETENHGEPLLVDTVFPVCNEAFLRAGGGRPTLSGATLFSDRMGDVTWRSLQDALRLTDDDLDQGCRFSHTVSVIEAAQSGAGLALGRLPLIADDLATGRLVRPFDMTFESGFAYFLIVADASKRRGQVNRIADWLRAEARTTVRMLRDVDSLDTPNRLAVP